MKVEYEIYSSDGRLKDEGTLEYNGVDPIKEAAFIVFLRNELNPKIENYVDGRVRIAITYDKQNQIVKTMFNIYRDGI